MVPCDLMVGWKTLAREPHFNLRREEWSLATSFPGDVAGHFRLFQSQTRRMVPCDLPLSNGYSTHIQISISDEKNGPLRHHPLSEARRAKGYFNLRREEWSLATRSIP